MGRKTTYPVLLAGVLTLLAVCLTAAVSQPVPNNVTGHMGGVSGAPVAGTYIQFQLTNCAGSPRILGYTGIAPFTGVFLPDDTGLITGTIWANNQIDCGGVTGNTRWMVTNVVNNIPQGLPTCYQVLSTSNPFNLDTASPAIPCITATPILPNDLNAHNLTLTGILAGVNGLFGGNLTAASFTLSGGAPTPCTSGQFMTGITASFVPVCGALPSGVVTSVFGRTGAIVPVSGDYNCAQITGAICSLGTIYYQTAQVNGTSQTQEPNLNLIAGPGATITAVDNPGAHSTDFTITPNAVPVGTATNRASPACGVVYQNLTGYSLYVAVSHQVAGGSGATMTATIGPTSTPTFEVGMMSAVAAFGSPATTMVPFIVPVGWYYEVTRDITCGIVMWTETTVP